MTRNQFQGELKTRADTSGKDCLFAFPAPLGNGPAGEELRCFKTFGIGGAP